MVESQEAKDGKVVVILLWLIWPVGLIWWLADEKMKNNSFVKHHIKQWLVAVIVLFTAYIIATILSVILIGLLLFPVIWVFSLIWLIQGIVFAVKGEEKELFLIGKYGKKFTF